MDRADYVYSLTALTGRRNNEDRRVVIATVELRRAQMIVGGVSLIASAPIALVVIPMLGMWSLVVPFIGVAVGLWLFDSRQGKGLRLRNYQAILDRRKTSNGTLYAAGAPLEPGVLVMHQPVVVPASAASPAVVLVDRARLAAERCDQPLRVRPRTEEMFG